MFQPSDRFTAQLVKIKRWKHLYLCFTNGLFHADDWLQLWVKSRNLSQNAQFATFACTDEDTLTLLVKFQAIHKKHLRKTEIFLNQLTIYYKKRMWLVTTDPWNTVRIKHGIWGRLHVRHEFGTELSLRKSFVYLVHSKVGLQSKTIIALRLMPHLDHLGSGLLHLHYCIYSTK